MPIRKLLSVNFGNEKARGLAWYRGQGGYEAALKAFSMKPEEVLKEVMASNLRGLGGAGFPTGRKWSFVPKNSGKPTYLVVNADESEPGTFKDKYIMTWDPHRLLEGMIIASWTCDIHHAYVYIRGEFVRPYEILLQAVQEAYAQGVLGPKVLGKDFALDVTIHRGAGAYICGEETGLLESLEGKKGWPRLKPPFPAVVGAFNSPTVLNNVETIAHLPEIIRNGGKWFADIGCANNGGTRLFCLSGCIERPGVYELPVGTALFELIFEHGGGIPNGKKLKAVIPGGSSAKVLTASEADVHLDVESCAKAGSMTGSGGVVVLDEDVCMVNLLRVITRFYAHESCGQCTPCREGTGWMLTILDRIAAGQGRPRDIDTLLSLSANMEGTSICALSEAAAWPVSSFVSKFRDEFEYFVQHGRSVVGHAKMAEAVG